MVIDVERAHRKYLEEKYQCPPAFECSLPPNLAYDLEALKKGVKEHSHLLDCLWGELYGSINIAEINDGTITHEQAQYLRDKYLWGEGCATRALTVSHNM